MIDLFLVFIVAQFTANLLNEIAKHFIFERPNEKLEKSFLQATEQLVIQLKELNSKLEQSLAETREVGTKVDSLASITVLKQPAVR